MVFCEIISVSNVPIPMNRLFSTIVLLTISVVCHAQKAEEHFYFKNFRIRDGLSQTTVNAILQDSRGFMWFGTKDGLNRYDGISFRQYKRDRNDPRSLGNNFVTALYEDTEGNIWVGTDTGVYIYCPMMDRFSHFSESSDRGTRMERSVSTIVGDDTGRVWIAAEGQGIFCYDLTEHTLHNHPLTDLTSVSSNVNCLNVESGGTIWVGFYGDGLFWSNDNLESLHPYTSPLDNSKTYEGDVISRIIPGAYNCLYISSVKGGVKELNLTSGRLRDLLTTDADGESIYCRNLLFSGSVLWIGTESGVYIYDLATDRYTHLRSSEYDPYSLSDNAIYSFCKDREEGIWIGSYFGGIDYYSPSRTYFEKYYPKGGVGSLHGKRVHGFCRDDRNVLWIGTEDGGLNRFDLDTKEFSFFAPSAAFTNIHGLCLVGDDLWVGTFSKGLKIIDTRTGTITRSYQKDDSPRSLIDNSIFAICRTAVGDILLGTMFGLLRYNEQTDDFDRIPELSGKFVHDIKEDSAGNIWLATYANGAYRYSASERKWKNYVHDSADERSLPLDKVSSIFEDSRRRIWLATQGGGFCLFDPRSESFTGYSTTDGLPSDVVYQIVEDGEGILWLTTNNGLVSFDPGDAEMRVYTTAHGLLGDQFNFGSSFRDGSGNIYFGGIDGFIVFDPADFAENRYLPETVITDFLLHNREVRPGKPDSPLEKSITYSPEIVLRAAQNSFSFRISTLGYQLPGISKPIYKLEGFDSDWISMGENPFATYSNLHYGNYIFRVRATDDSGTPIGNETSLAVRILPPFYMSVWACCLYVLLLAGGSVWLALYLKHRSTARQRWQMAKFEQEKEREVYNAKIDFFTNVAHEIRTPLTLICGPLESVMLKNPTDADTRENLDLMKQNTERLKSLTDQLLDFRKTESHGFRLNFVECNITEILGETFKRFSPLAKQKGLKFDLAAPPHDIRAHVNSEALTKIISNLLGNSVKYARSYVHVFLETAPDGGKPVFRIRTVNDGVLVPDGMREEIFKPFVRFDGHDDGNSTTGTGIGLALSRSLAELHDGSLEMAAGERENVFLLTLPVEQKEAIKLSGETKLAGETGLAECPAKKTDGKHTVLVVDDNPDMLAFVARQLGESYTVLVAAGGAEALDVLDENEVSLVVSDVLMPRMDGFELCGRIKSGLNYSHVPVVLLTAKNNVRSKIEGLESGADAYVEKPFSVEYLRACVANLINSREKLRQAFAQSPFMATGTMGLTKADDEFMKKLNEIIRNNYHDPEFSMDDIVDSLNMSRSNFYRKIKGVLDLSPNEYLRLERLKQAARLLKEGGARVNEVCYMVGFSSPSYFSKCFQKQFGLLPKEFVGTT